MNRISIVQSIIKKTCAENYLEIGVSLGHTFLTIDVKRKIGVDPKNLIMRHVFAKRDDWMLEAKKAYRFICQCLGFEKSDFYEMASDEFFRTMSHLFERREAEVALIDGLHSYDQALRDVLNCLKHLDQNGVLVLHDCNPATLAQAIPANSVAEAAAKKVPGWDYLWCGDVWKAIVYLRSSFADLNVFVLDCDMGVGIVTRGKMENRLLYTPEEIGKLTFQDLDANRTRLLNLKPPAYFNDFLNQLPGRLGQVR
ncbi:MAG: class I SAM-dependent methyltransferase [Candidatus Omnitrophota bacterium]